MIRVLEPNKDYIIRADRNGIVDDVVEVVRCKDCKRYRHDDVFHRWYCSIGMTKRATSKDDYCSWGERRGEWQEPEEPKINPCRGCDDYDGQGGCKSNGGCGAKIDEVTE